MHRLHRRQLLQAAGAGIAAFHLPLGLSARRGAAEEDGAPVLVVLYLRGGMDPLHALVPHGDERYYALRPTLGVPPEDTEEGPGVVRLDSEFGLHPALASLAPLWKEKRLAAVVNVGSPHPTRSHFDAQDFMEYAAPGLRNVRSGWLNRFLTLSAPESDSAAEGEVVRLRALAMQGLLPRALRGPHPALAVPDQEVVDDNAVRDLFGELYGAEGEMTSRETEGDVFATGRTTIETLALFRRLARDGATRKGVTYPRTRLARRLATLARVIRAGAGLEVAAIDVNGWDTHTQQGLREGTMPRLLGEVGEGVAAFLADLGPAAERTVVVTMSEFGRTCRENGNYGTDHGHGGLMLLAGGRVAGGKVHGDWAGLGDDDLYQGRDLKVTTDFRDVLAEVLRRHFEFDLPRDFFPDYRPGRVKGLFG